MTHVGYITLTSGIDITVELYISPRDELDGGSWDSEEGGSGEEGLNSGDGLSGDEEWGKDEEEAKDIYGEDARDAIRHAEVIAARLAHAPESSGRGGSESLGSSSAIGSFLEDMSHAEEQFERQQVCVEGGYQPHCHVLTLESVCCGSAAEVVTEQ